jgi:hypothetical protein
MSLLNESLQVELVPLQSRDFVILFVILLVQSSNKIFSALRLILPKAVILISLKFRAIALSINFMQILLR